MPDAHEPVGDAHSGHEIPQRVAVVISPEQYERMLDALEEAEDAVAFDAAMEEEGQNITWAQAKADMGWS